jgi:branched-chain amino acid transport system substrate-binding protein
MKALTRRSILVAGTGALALGIPLLAPRVARAKDYGPGVTDTEIKIGNTAPYSGPASSYGTMPSPRPHTTRWSTTRAA